MDEEPIIESAAAKLTEAGVDEEITAVLSFKSGVKATIESRMTPGWEYYARFVVEAENGSVTLINSILPHLGHSIVERLDGDYSEFTLAGSTTFDYQLAELVTALKTGEPMVTEGQNPIGNVRAIGEIYRAAGVNILRRAE